MSEPRFVNSTEEVGGLVPKSGGLILQRPALVDVNGDGFDDIIAVSTANEWNNYVGTLRLFMNYKGKKFVDETDERGLDIDWKDENEKEKIYIHHATAFDFHNHGHYDLYVSHRQHAVSDTRLFLNDGTGHFVNSGIEFKHGSKGSGAIDVNDDGFCDLFDSGVFNSHEGGTLYMNHKGEDLVDETAKRFKCGPPLGYQGPVFADYNNDGYPEMYTTGHKYTHCYMFRNDGAGFFTDVTSQYDLTFEKECDGADGAVFADMNNNGNLDLIVVNEGMVWIHENIDNGKAFSRRTVIDAKNWCDPKLNQAGGGDAAMVSDFNNDGYLDLWVAGTPYIYRNEGNFEFTKAWAVPIIRSPSWPEGRQATFGDLNNDGAIDIVFGSFRPPKLQFIRNDMPNEKNWLQINLIGPYGDAGGYGVRVSVFDAGHPGDMSHFKGMRESRSGYMYHVTPTKTLHFGGLNIKKKYDLVVRLPFKRGEFVVHKIKTGRHIKIDCSCRKTY
jgi:hypothetical protein